jgi:hypothetical protein
VRRGESWELGSSRASGYLRTSTDTLLRLSGVERAPFDLERLLRQVRAEHGGATLDTGPPTDPLRERDHGVQREVLYVDDATRASCGARPTPRG